MLGLCCSSHSARASSLVPGTFDQDMSTLSPRLTSRKSSLAQGAYDQETSPLGPGLTSQRSSLSQQSSLSSEGSGTLTHRRSVIFMQKGSSRRGSSVKGQAGGSQGDNQRGPDSGEQPSLFISLSSGQKDSEISADGTWP